MRRGKQQLQLSMSVSRDEVYIQRDGHKDEDAEEGYNSRIDIHHSY